MADQKLTQRAYIDDTSPDAIIHVVESGSSYKQTKENFLKDVVPVTEVYKENQIIDRSYYWVDGTYSYVVVSVKWYEDGTIYDEIFNTTVTMSAADGTYDRIDRVVLNMATDVVEVVEGAPAAVPAPPSLSTDQYELFFVTVETATTEPSTATIYTIYRENAQVVGGEWNTTTSGSAVTNSIVSPYLGTYHVALTAKNDYVDFVPASPIGTGAGTLVFSLKLPDILTTPLFAFKIDGSGASSSFSKTIKQDYIGFNSSSADYQTISINLTEAEVSELSTLRITCLRNGSLIYFDEIYLQQAADTQVPPESINASNITVDTTNFDNNLTSADDTVQKALDTIDDLALGAGSLSNIVEDTTPQLGGDLDLNGKEIINFTSIAVNQSTHGFSVGDAIKHNGTIFTKAQGTSVSTAGTVGIVSASSGVNDFEYQTTGLFTSGTWTAGTDYFLSVSTAGLVSTEPTYAAGNVRQFIGRGVTGGLLLNIEEGDEMIAEAILIECSDQTTALTTGTAKRTFRMPYAFSLLEVRASLIGAGSTSGTTTIDINESAVSVLGTKLTIDFGEKTSTTAATPAVISDSSIADDAEITIDIDAVTGGADEYGLIVTLLGTHA